MTEHEMQVRLRDAVREVHDIQARLQQFRDLVSVEEELASA